MVGRITKNERPHRQAGPLSRSPQYTQSGQGYSRGIFFIGMHHGSLNRPETPKTARPPRQEDCVMLSDSTDDFLRRFIDGDPSLGMIVKAPLQHRKRPTCWGIKYRCWSNAACLIAISSLMNGPAPTGTRR